MAIEKFKDDEDGANREEIDKYNWIISDILNQKIVPNNVFLDT